MKIYHWIVVSFLIAVPLTADSALLSTTWGGTNRVGGGYMFDLTATDSAGIRLHKWFVNLDSFNFQQTIRIWHRDGSYVGNESSSSGWVVLGEGTVASAGSDNPVMVPMPVLDLPFNQTVGIFIHATNWVTNQPPFLPGMRGRDIPPASSTYVEPGLRLDGAVFRGDIPQGSDPFASPWAGNIMSSGMIDFAPVPEPATVAALGIGLAALAARRRRK